MPADAEVADLERRRLISEQMPVLRAKPFVAGAIFWTYQDYRTPTDYHMGVMDAHRRRRGLWAILSEAYAPVVIDSVGLSTVYGGIQQAEIAIQARGPVHIDMPAYTLRGYSLQWQVVRVENPVLLAYGDLPCPILAPAAS